MPSCVCLRCKFYLSCYCKLWGPNYGTEKVTLCNGKVVGGYLEVLGGVEQEGAESGIIPQANATSFITLEVITLVRVTRVAIFGNIHERPVSICELQIPDLDPLAFAMLREVNSFQHASKIAHSKI